MHPVLGEVVPEVPALLESLLALAFFGVALGIISLIAYIVAGVAQVLDRTVGKLPGIGGIISGATNDIASIITSWLGSAANAVDRDISFWWHGLTLEASWLGQQIAETARVVWFMAGALTPSGLIRILKGDAQFYKQIFGSGASASSRQQIEIEALRKELRKVEREDQTAAVKRLEKTLKADIGAIETTNVQTQPWFIGAVEGVVNPDIQALRDRAKSLENDAIQVYKDAAGAWQVVNSDALDAAMAIGLAGLGLDWLRCNSAGNLFGKNACNVWSGLGDVLGLLGLALAVEDLPALVKLGQEVVHDATVAIEDVLSV